jgi:hypothetical protein
MKHTRFIFLILLLAGCTSVLPLSPPVTPLPGWREIVSDLLLTNDDLPDGWDKARDWPKDSLVDPTINHVYRSWWRPSLSYGVLEQHIWRGNSTDDAHSVYLGLRQDQYDPIRTPHPDKIYIPYKTPIEIDFQGGSADEFYIACGWSGFPRCVAIARYRNYTVELITDWETIGPDGKVRNGLTTDEIETILKAMDMRFVEFLNAFPLATPSP